MPLPEIKQFVLSALIACPISASAIAAPTEGVRILSGRVDRISSDTWTLSGVDAEFEVDADSIRARVRIDRLDFSGAEAGASNIEIACPRLRFAGAHIRCAHANFSAMTPQFGRISTPGSFAYDRRTEITAFELSRVQVGSGELRLAGTSDSDGVRMEYDGRDVPIEELYAIARRFGFLPNDVITGGSVSATGSLALTDRGLSRISLRGTLDAASIANDLGTLVAESVNGRVSMSADNDGGVWIIDVEIRADGGETYFEPVYANLAEHAVTLRLDDMRTTDFRSLTMPEFSLVQDSQLALGGSLDVVLPETASDTLAVTGDLTIGESSVDAIYSGLLQVLAAGTLLGELETSGRVSGHVRLDGNVPTATTLTFTDLTLDDQRRRFAIYGMNGQVNWPGPGANPGNVPSSRLRWESAAVYGILIEGGGADLRLGDDDVELVDSLRLPMMGGAVVVNEFRISGYGTDAATGLLDAVLEPIQLGQLTTAFGWPAFSGSLSGRLPFLQYEGNAMTVGGRLTAQAFDGSVEFSDLRIEQPFGLVPRLTGNLTLRNLDLERLTKTFSFGLIQGRLSGDVAGLEMIAWQPVAMDLHLYTPADDKSRHRISQRAVENLASVGGGSASAALSSGLLGFFEVFAYDRIGLRCVLKDGTCAMSGAGPARAGPAGQGYYIVKGKGVPRIDVVGFRDRVSWPRLVRQLRTITGRQEPTIR